MSRGGAGAVVWKKHDPRRERPPLDAELAGWEIRTRRASHWNACRDHAGRTYHLKWVFARGAAEREFRNARRVAELGVPSVVPVGWGRHPAGSFFVMEGSPGRAIYDLDGHPERGTSLRLAAELGARGPSA